MTCGHLFRESQGKGQMSVDVFPAGARPCAGTSSHAAVLRLRTRCGVAGNPPERPRAAGSGGHGRLSTASRRSRVQHRLRSGRRASLRESQVTALNKYKGPPNIESAGQPVIGRSGGGLFSADGQLIGVCNLADPQDNEGIYAALPLLHANLDKIGQCGSTSAVRRLMPLRRPRPGPLPQVCRPRCPLVLSSVKPSRPLRAPLRIQRPSSRPRRKPRSEPLRRPTRTPKSSASSARNETRGAEPNDLLGPPLTTAAGPPDSGIPALWRRRSGDAASLPKRRSAAGTHSPGSGPAVRGQTNRVPPASHARSGHRSPGTITRRREVPPYPRRLFLRGFAF